MRRAAPALLTTLLFACSSPRGASQSAEPAEKGAPREALAPGAKSPEATSATGEAKEETESSRAQGAPEPIAPAPPPPPAARDEATPMAEQPKATAKGGASKNKRSDDDKSAAPMAATTKSLSGRLSSADVEGVVTSAIDRFAKCTTVDLTVEIKAVIGGDGKVIEVKIPRSQPDDPRARDCVVASFKELAFPKASDNKSSPIAFELNLRRRSE